MMECDGCGLRSGDLPGIGLEEEEDDIFFQKLGDGRTLCVGCMEREGERI